MAGQAKVFSALRSWLASELPEGGERRFSDAVHAVYKRDRRVQATMTTCSDKAAVLVCFDAP